MRSNIFFQVFRSSSKEEVIEVIVEKEEVIEVIVEKEVIN